MRVSVALLFALLGLALVIWAWWATRPTPLFAEAPPPPAAHAPARPG
jgi:hypothetical protein